MAPASTSSQTYAHSSTPERDTLPRQSPFSDEDSASTHTSLHSVDQQKKSSKAPSTYSTIQIGGPTNHAEQKRPTGRGGRVTKQRSRAQKNKYEFITINNPDQSRDPALLQRVRRKAMNYSLEQTDNKLSERTQRLGRADTYPRLAHRPRQQGLGGSQISPTSASSLPDSDLRFPHYMHEQEPFEIRDEVTMQRYDIPLWTSGLEPDATEDFIAAPPLLGVMFNEYESPHELITPPAWPLAFRDNDSVSSKTPTPSSEPKFYWPLAVRGHGQDPFDSLPRPKNPTINVVKLKHNCVTFFSSEGLRKYWASRALDNRLFFFSALTIASRHEDALLGVIDSGHTLALETEVISMLNKTVADPEQQASDDTIATVMHLATAQNYRREDSSIHWYGFMLSLVDKRGGFPGLTSFPALPWILTMNALGSSVLRECPPPPPFFIVAGMQIEAASQNPFILESPVCSPESGFAVIPYSKYGSDQTSELLEMMRRLVDTATVDGTSRSARDHYTSQRDLIHMQLLAHKSADVPGHEASGDYVYESCRLASIILEKALYNSTSFSGAVAHTNLVSLLKVALSRTPLETMWGDMAGVLIWIAFVGAAAAHYSPERQLLVGVGTRAAIKHSFTRADSVTRCVYKLCQIQAFCTMGETPDTQLLSSPRSPVVERF